jgi:pyridoxine 5-phosphate synthase
MRVRLGVNVDHVATIRQARGTRYPDPVAAAAIAELAGADQITIHLREDRRHIQDRDLRILRETVQTRLNLEMAGSEEMVRMALVHHPDTVTLVPERREERTTESGLDVARLEATLRPLIDRLREGGIGVSLFIHPDPSQVAAAGRLGVDTIELHTGVYVEATGVTGRTGVEQELVRLQRAATQGAGLGLEIAAGHGLDYVNVREVARIPEVVELNIGHAIIARSILVGLERAVAEMAAILRDP